MIGDNNKEHVKMGKNICKDCCLCPIPKRRKEPASKDLEHTELSMIAPTVDEKPPFVDDLPTNIGPGSCIIVHGIIKPDCSRFSINLCSSKEPDSDIAFHLNPRLSLRQLVRTVRVNGTWGPEETTLGSKFELARNQEFDFNIVLTLNEFLVSLNGRHICAFVYRMPLTKVKALRVEGCVDIQKVDHKTIDVYPPPCPRNVPFTVAMRNDQKKIPEEKMDMPVIATLPKGFHQGWQLEIYGRVKILPSAFYINLQNGVHLWPHPVIYLHLNARFNISQGRHLLIKNAWFDGSWGQEERSIGHRFTPGSLFSLAIRHEGDRFSTWIDGTLIGEFRFRKEADKINSLYIQGDIDVHCIYTKDKIDDKYFNARDSQQQISL